MLRHPQILEDLLEFCFPGTCGGCGAFCTSKARLCDACESELKRLASAPSCQLCGMPLATHGTPCAFCQGAGIAHYERVLRLGVFEEPLRPLIHRLKYHRDWAVGEQLADWLIDQERVKGILSQADCVLPVPLHFLRRFKRGYNQSEIIARRIARRCRMRLVQPVRRRRNTETQTHLHSRAQRLTNLRDAFELRNPDSISDRNVVVIDDVMTTGATLQTLARTLKAAKPASLCAIVVAVADPMGKGFETT